MTDSERLLIFATDELDRALLNPLVTGPKAGQRKIKTHYPQCTVWRRLHPHLLSRLRPV
jgi:hypothetical protein